jgi:hypothetical protein
MGKETQERNDIDIEQTEQPKYEEQPYFGNSDSATDRGPQFADRTLLRRSGPVQNRSGPAGP